MSTPSREDPTAGRQLLRITASAGAPGIRPNSAAQLGAQTDTTLTTWEALSSHSPPRSSLTVLHRIRRAASRSNGSASAATRDVERRSRGNPSPHRNPRPPRPAAPPCDVPEQDANNAWSAAGRRLRHCSSAGIVEPVPETEMNGCRRMGNLSARVSAHAVRRHRRGPGTNGLSPRTASLSRGTPPGPPPSRAARPSGEPPGRLVGSEGGTRRTLDSAGARDLRPASTVVRLGRGAVRTLGARCRTTHAGRPAR